jgi:hypothetical protein
MLGSLYSSDLVTNALEPKLVLIEKIKNEKLNLLILKKNCQKHHHFNSFFFLILF